MHVDGRYMWIAVRCGWQIYMDGRYMWLADVYMWIADTCGEL
jgi:hypothetical protein